MRLRGGAVEFTGRGARRESAMQTPGNAEENAGTSSIGAVDIAGPVRIPACALVRRPVPQAGCASHSLPTDCTARRDASASRSAEPPAPGPS